MLFARVLLRRIVTLVAVLLVAAYLTGRFPDGSRTSLVLRAATGVAVGAVLIGVVRRSMRALTDPPPPPPAQVDARPADVVYTCAVCGTRVRLEVAATGKPPKHCGEEMEPALA